MMNRAKIKGIPPGALHYTGARSGNDRVKITLIEFNEHEYFEKDFYEFSECLQYIRPDMVKWINVEGVHDVELVETIGHHYNLHPLTLEDIVHIEQRPKFEDYDDYLLSVMKMIVYDTEVHTEQLSLILQDKLVISFQEPQSGDAFNVIRERLRQGVGRVRRGAADYLFYALMDAVIDWYFLAVEKIGDKIEVIEEQIMSDPKHEVLVALYALKREIIHLRKQVWPVRDLVSNMIRNESKFLSPGTQFFLRDLHDHSTRIIDTVETYRDLLSGMMDIYLSTNTNKMNEVMKVLTVMSSVFIPVTFVAGVYGMNFENMPELHSRYGYMLVWLIMLLMIGGLLYYFRRRKWI